MHVHKLFIAQIVLVLLLACGWGAANHAVIPSILVGGAACLLPNLYFAYRFFSVKHKKSPGQILISFYIGELIKMLVSAALIILAVMYLHAQLLPTVVSYFVANLAFWMAPTMVLKQTMRAA